MLFETQFSTIGLI